MLVHVAVEQRYFVAVIEGQLGAEQDSYGGLPQPPFVLPIDKVAICTSVLVLDWPDVPIASCTNVCNNSCLEVVLWHATFAIL
jgi:hypothetical protein